MEPSEKDRIIANYRQLFLEHGTGPAVGQWSAEGQRFRFEKLVQIADLSGTRVLDVGCGIGDLLPFLRQRYTRVDYTGVDIVPDLVSYAANTYPDALFHCADIVIERLPGQFDFALISGVFNNRMRDATATLQRILTAAFSLCTQGIGFNFTSNRVNTVDPDMAYHDPMEVLRFCIENLSNKVIMAHHYERCDVSVYVYRSDTR